MKSSKNNPPAGGLPNYPEQAL